MTATETLCGAGVTKRKRATRAEMEHRKKVLFDIVAEAAPTGVRFAYYRAVSKGIIPKTNNGYKMVQRALMDLRESGEMPWTWLVDSSRWMRKPESWTSRDAFAENVVTMYRRNLWADTDDVVEVWCESESVAGVLYQVTARWDVPLYPIKGQTSAAFAYAAAQTYRDDPRPLTIYYVGDHDPAGVEIELHLMEKLRRFSGRPDLRVHRLACTPAQTPGLIGTPPKQNYYTDPDGTQHRWDGDAFEVEAIDAPVLRELVDNAIEAHIDPATLRLHRAVESAERADLFDMLEALPGDSR